MSPLGNDKYPAVPPIAGCVLVRAKPATRLLPPRISFPPVEPPKAPIPVPICNVPTLSVPFIVTLVAVEPAFVTTNPAPPPNAPLLLYCTCVFEPPGAPPPPNPVHCTVRASY